ncbi:MAG: histidine phosphatase family protein [Burkholderiales bacterium]
MSVHDALPKLYLVRHGETAWTVSGRHTGRTDLALTEQGENEARSVRPRLENLRFALVLSSPLQRARRTAELAGFGDAVQSDPDLTEWDYGAYEGRRTAEIRAEHAGWNLFDDGCPEGETLRQIGRRADRVIERVRTLNADALVFAHRDILRILVARWLGLPAREGRYFYLATASLNILGYDHQLDEPVIRLLNEVSR